MALPVFQTPIGRVPAAQARIRRATRLNDGSRDGHLAVERAQQDAVRVSRRLAAVKAVAASKAAAR